MTLKKKLNFIFLLVFIISIFYNSSFIKPHEISGDYFSNFKNSISISANSKNLSYKEKLEASSRPIIVPYINSFFIKSFFDKEKIKLCYEEIDLKDETLLFSDRNSLLSDSCKSIHEGLQYFFLFLFYILIFSTLWIGILFKLDNLFLLLIFSVLCFNTFFLSKVLNDSTEILSSIFLNLSIISIFYYLRSYLHPIFLGISLAALFLCKKIFLFSPIFIILLGILLLIKQISIKKILINSSLAILFFIITIFTSNLLFKNLTIKDKSFFSKGNHILVIRASYLLNINIKNYLIAGVSFTPIYGDIILKKFKDYELVQPFLDDPDNIGRDRNRIMIYANPIVLDYYMKLKNVKSIDIDNYKNFFTNGVLTYPTIIDVYKNNFFKNILCTPLFLYRSLFPGIGKDVLNYKYNNLNGDIFKFLLNFFKIFNPLLIITLIIFFFLSLRKIKKNSHAISLSLPIFSLLLHSFITHGLGRYSSILIPFSIVIFCLCINQYISKKHE